MLLQRLVEYAQSTTLPPTGYDLVPIHWVVELDSKRVASPSFIPTFESEKKKDKGKICLAPFRERTSTANRPKLLADNGEYTFGISKEGMKGDRNALAAKFHQQYLELLRDCSSVTGEQRLDIVLHYLTNWQTEWLPNDFETDSNITFSVDGHWLIADSKIGDYWAKKFWQFASEDKDEEDEEESSDDLSATEMECHICGISCTPIVRHPFKIKGIPKGQPKGNAIISANKAAFTSFGLKASLVAPTCGECVEKYAKAANNLLQNEGTHLIVGPFAYIFWTKTPESFAFASVLSKPDAAQVQQLMESVFTGRFAALDLDKDVFYAAAFSASVARVAVRDWLETTVGNVKQNLARYFRLQCIIEPDGSGFKPMGLTSIASATVPLKQEKPDYNKIPPNVPKALLKCALEGKLLPDWLLYKAVQRIKAEAARLESPKHDWRRKSCAALIKMVLASHTNEITQEGNYMEQLDHTNRDTAYLCGRLLGVLESVQYAALHKPNSSIIGRFYGTASSAPASVFGPLLRGAQAHLDKLRKTKEGTYNALQQKLEEVQSGMTAFPKTLTLQQQGLFALGYYHQRAKDRGDREAYKQMKASESSDTNQ